jgi:hypothetical protein
MIEFWLVAGIVAARCKATTMVGEVNLHSARNGIRAPYDFERYTKPNLPNFGSLGTPYYFMARNHVMNDFPVPCIMRYDSEQGKEFNIPGDPMDEPNIYDILMQKEPIKFTSADVSRGEVSGNVLDPLTDDVFVKLNVHPDTRITDIEYSMNAVRMYRIPIFTVLDSDEVPESLRVQMYLLSLFNNGKQNLKEGFFMNAGMGMFNVNKIKSYLNVLSQDIIVKDDTESTGPQMASPNTIQPGKSTQVSPPPAIKSTPDGALSSTEQEAVINETREEQSVATKEAE